MNVEQELKKKEIRDEENINYTKMKKILDDIDVQIEQIWNKEKVIDAEFRKHEERITVNHSNIMKFNERKELYKAELINKRVLEMDVNKFIDEIKCVEYNAQNILEDINQLDNKNIEVKQALASYTKNLNLSDKIEKLKNLKKKMQTEKTTMFFDLENTLEEAYKKEKIYDASKHIQKYTINEQSSLQKIQLSSKAIINLQELSDQEYSSNLNNSTEIYDFLCRENNISSLWTLFYINFSSFFSALVLGIYLFFLSDSKINVFSDLWPGMSNFYWFLALFVVFVILITALKLFNIITFHVISSFIISNILCSIANFLLITPLVTLLLDSFVLSMSDKH